MEVRRLGQEPGGCFHFVRRRLLVGLTQEIQCSFDVTVKLAKGRAFDKTRHVAGPKVQHPLRRFLRFVVIAQADGRLSDVSIHRHVVWRLPVKRVGLFKRLGKLLPAEQDRYLGLPGLEVAGRKTEGLVNGLFRLPVVCGVRSLTHPPHQGHGKLVVSLELIRILLEGVSRPRDLLFGRRELRVDLLAGSRSSDGAQCTDQEYEGTGFHLAHRHLRRRVNRLPPRRPLPLREATVGPSVESVMGSKGYFVHGGPEPPVHPGSPGSMWMRSRPLGQ